MPTRVLYVKEKTLRLHYPEGSRGEWVVLSHCWGTQSRCATTTQNLERWKEAIPFDNLPPTFQDAILATRSLGYEYLWIDSLCILQDSHDDWIRESSKMRDYYKNSSLAITSDVASGDHEGFFNVKRPTDDREINIPWTRRGIIAGIKGHWLSNQPEEAETFTIRSVKTCPELQSCSTPVSKRAWALQEDILAPRTLHYTADQLVWDCLSMKKCESGDRFIGKSLKQSFVDKGCDSIKAKLDLGDDVTEWQRWYKVVVDFSRRFLTYENDLLPAISGIAREIQERTRGTYCAGIWIEDIANGLIWTTNGASYTLDAYRAPSFSWAALGHHPVGKANGSIDLWRDLRALEEGWKVIPIATVLEHNIVLEDNDPFGRVKSGHIKLCGPWLPAVALGGQNNIHINAYWRGCVLSHCAEFIKYSPFLSDDPRELICHFDIFSEKSDISKALEGVELFQISRADSRGRGRFLTSVTFALMLRPVESTIYRRVGIAEIPYMNRLREENWEMREVTII
jgi:hypothetical protein